MKGGKIRKADAFEKSQISILWLRESQVWKIFLVPTFLWTEKAYLFL